MKKRPNTPLTVKEEQEIKALLASGKTYHAVAIAIGRDPKTVKKYATQPEAAKSIAALRGEFAEMFEGVAKRMIQSITDDDIRNLNAYQRTLSSGIAVDKARMLRDRADEAVPVKVTIEIVGGPKQENDIIDITPAGEEGSFV